MTTIERETSTAAVMLPPGPPFPRAVQGALALANRRIALQIMRRVYGSAFTIDLSIFARLVVISDPNDIRRLFKTAPHLADTTDTTLGRVMGPDSMFALTGDRHRAQRNCSRRRSMAGGCLPMRRSSSAKRSTSSQRGHLIKPSRRCPR
jgi:cytochrome P450 family 138